MTHSSNYDADTLFYQTINQNYYDMLYAHQYIAQMHALPLWMSEKSVSQEKKTKLSYKKVKNVEIMKIKEEKTSTVIASAKEDMDENLKTTVMMRKLPPFYSSKDLLDMLHAYEYLEHIDFVYVPIDFRAATVKNFGYAFVNFVEPEDARTFKTMIQGFTEWGPRHCPEGTGTWKPCETLWSSEQGLEARIEKYRSSALMHESVPDIYKPVLLKNGEFIDFPITAADVKVRMRHAKVSAVQTIMTGV